MGVSVSTGVIDTLLERFGTVDFGAACKAYTIERNLGLFVIIAISAQDDGTIHKNLFIFECADNPAHQAI